MESIKRELMRSVQRPGIMQRASSQSKEELGKSGESGTVKPPATKIKFPEATELAARSDIAFINPEKYILGPGDGLRIVIYGRFFEENRVMVRPGGSIFLYPAGDIVVKGHTINGAKDKVYRIMKRYYRDFKVHLEITKLRTIQVRILGEVTNPGTYVITPVIGICDAIGMAGGLKDNASLRNVLLRDDRGKKVGNIDLFSWYFLGEEGQNKLIEQKSVIFVPLMQEQITLDGAFRRKGTFEIIPGERITDIIKMAELQPGAVLSEGRLTRIKDGELEIKKLDLDRIVDVEKFESEKDILLSDGDNIYVPNLDMFSKKIRVIGELKGANFFSTTINKLTGETEIQKIGLYNLKKGETVKDVVVALGGTTVKANVQKARVERPLKNGNVKVISVNLRKLMSGGDESQNVALREGDTLIVPAMPDSVYILGEIRAPGAYQYNVGNKIKEYVALAGGPTRKAKLRHVKIISQRGDNIKASTIDLRSILTGNLKEEIELRPGDVIYIPHADIVSWKDILGIMTELIVIRQLFKI
ncbi:MAG: SLBB domain-containing protein [Candidatus Eremiobacteraeota bacterium]|nr:SLBB domain-containing protein [Candidatus Eremiobacteraeota bacterium]